MMKLVNLESENITHRNYKTLHKEILETNTFEVFRKEDICVRGPLNTSCNRHPRPHISVDLKRKSSTKKNSLHSPFCYFFASRFIGYFWWVILVEVMEQLWRRQSIF